MMVPIDVAISVALLVGALCLFAGWLLPRPERPSELDDETGEDDYPHGLAARYLRGEPNLNSMGGITVEREAQLRASIPGWGYVRDKMVTENDADRRAQRAALGLPEE